MVKPEWGTKRTCPKCSTRFYDLGNDNPVHCIECANEWVPEPVLKSKQPMAFEAAAPVAKEPRPIRISRPKSWCRTRTRRSAPTRKSTSTPATRISGLKPPARTTKSRRVKLEVIGAAIFPLFQRGMFPLRREDVGP